MFTRRLCTQVCAVLLMLPAAGAAGYSVVTAEDAPPLVQLAAKEIARYAYLRTGALPSGEGEARIAAAVMDGLAGLDVPEAVARAARDLAPEGYLLRTEGGSHYCIGGSETAALYAAYRFAHALGVRFYLHGDTVPDARQADLIATLRLDETDAPLFELRGIQPFHDFPEGPDWWNEDDYKAVIAQLPKMRMNFFGLHTYPENRPAAEPATWIGLPEDVNGDGTVQFAYPALWYNTALTSGWGFTGMRTGDFHWGGALLFDRDAYGNDVLNGFEPMPDDPEDCVTLFNRTGALFNRAFTLARALGVKICIGTETPLVTPARVARRILGDAPPAGLVAEGGSLAHYTAPIADTDDDPLYQHVRYNLDAYRVDVPDGLYTVVLRFAEPHYNTAGARVFGVKLEGETVIPTLDVFAEVGKDRALDFTFEQVAVTDGRLDIEFIRQVEFPCIAAIEVIGEDRAWRVNCGGPRYQAFDAGDETMALDADHVARLYEGIFTRIMRTHPLDYYWLWTPEGWTWGDVTEAQVEATIADMRLAYDALRRLGAPFEMATCGWVLGPQFNRSYLGEVLPKDVTVSCINRSVGHDPTEPGFAGVEGRGKWAIPWLEDDPAMTSMQLWAGRMRRDARLARDYGCNGLMGIHWRTRVLSMNAAALAEAAWNQDGWEEPGPDAPGRDKVQPPHWPAGDFYADWARAEFGPEAAGEAAAVFTRLDGRLPRPSDWIGGPGGYVPDARPWAEVSKEYGFVDKFAALRPRVRGEGNLERFDYWLNNFAFLRATARMKCDWHLFNQAMEAAVNAETPEARRARARDEALPARIALVHTVETACRHLIATVSTPGAMGAVSNLEQHTFPGMLHQPAATLADLLGEALPPEAMPSTGYGGPDRIVVTTRRGAVEPGETLTLKAAALTRVPPAAMTLHWRAMGTGEFTAAPMQPADRQTYVTTLAPEDIGEPGIEYYMQLETADGARAVWPPAAPELCQTVVRMPEMRARE